MFELPGKWGHEENVHQAHSVHMIEKRPFARRKWIGLGSCVQNSNLHSVTSLKHTGWQHPTKAKQSYNSRVQSIKETKLHGGQKAKFLTI